MACPKDSKTVLTNCDRNLIHIPDSIQPHGAMLVVSPDSFNILSASANAGAMT
jgi:light-regulated signal transduction histidine kinase (bacteriophytochrome)